jgi:hypothetical protein
VVHMCARVLLEEPQKDGGKYTWRAHHAESEVELGVSKKPGLHKRIY